MIVLCVGVLLGGWTREVTAVTYSKSDSYVVHASVPGPPPTVAATIDNPTNGEKFTATPINVNGSCPIDTYVALYRNNFMSGVAICDATGSWHLTTDLFVGTNQLKAVDYSFTDVAGPDSQVVTVYYQPETAQSGGGQTGQGGIAGSAKDGTGSTASSTPLSIKSDFSFQGYYVGTEITWQLIIDGGNAPYAISVDWGDGTSNLLSLASSGSFTFSHKYKKTGGYHGSYAPIFKATDGAGNQTSLQLLAIVSNRPTPVAASTSQGNTLSGLAALGGQSVARFIKYAWPAYGMVVLMLTSYWLGERREYHILKPHVSKLRHG
jgi:hypothetical protein